MKNIALATMLLLSLVACQKRKQRAFDRKDYDRHGQAETTNNLDDFLFLCDTTKKIYGIGTTLKYAFEFKGPASKRKNSISEKDVSSINFVNAVVVNLGDGQNLKPALKYSYPPKTLASSSLIIENDSMVWIHPPRRHFFKILEINPFPSISKSKKSWVDTLKIGPQYADDRWALWGKNLVNVSNYEIVGDTILDTPLGYLECRKTHATSKNILGTSTLDSYFNDVYGFVLLRYRNIDHSTLDLKLIDYHKEGRLPKFFMAE